MAPITSHVIFEECFINLCTDETNASILMVITLETSRVVLER